MRKERDYTLIVTLSPQNDSCLKMGSDESLNSLSELRSCVKVEVAVLGSRP